MTEPDPTTASSADSPGQVTGAPPPPLDEKVRAQAAALRKQLREARTRGQRSLFIHVMLMFLVSIVVFVVGTYFFMIPRVIRQSLDVRLLEQRMVKLNARVAQLERPEPLTPAAGLPAGDPPAPVPAPAIPAPAPVAPAPTAPPPTP